MPRYGARKVVMSSQRRFPNGFVASFSVLAVAALFGLAPACSSESDDAAAGLDGTAGSGGSNVLPPAPPVELDQFCARYAAARCVGVQDCCPSSSGKYADAPTCTGAEQSSCETTLLPTLSNPAYTYDAAAAGALIAAMERAGNRCSEPEARLAVATLLKPALPPGSPCTIGMLAVGGNPCVDSFCDPGDSLDMPGTCAVLPGEGEMCDGICGVGLGCVSELGRSYCRRVPAEGEPCEGLDDVCALGTKCELTADALRTYFAGEPMEEFTCQRLLPNGALAIDPRDCASGLLEHSNQFTLEAKCVACRDHEDCLNDPNAMTFDGRVSLDTYSGYCERGVCYHGRENVLPASKPLDAICFDDGECRSLRCNEASGTELDRCGEPDLEPLFCSATPGGSDAGTDGG